MPKSKESKEQALKAKAVQNYRDVSAVFKTNLITNVNEAFTQGAITFENENDRERFLSLLESFIDIHQANGHEQFVRLTK